MSKRLGVHGWAALMAAVLTLLVMVPVLNLVVPEASAFHLSDYAVSLLGKILCYAICALAMDLIWGYTGILSLGHGLFFALGGYAMGMYLMRQIGSDGQYRLPMPDFMVFLNWKVFPWHWAFRQPGLPARHGRARTWGVSVRLRLLRISLAHQGRVLFDHYAGADLRGHAALLPQ